MSDVSLTPRQHMVATLLGQGACNKDIARELGITVRAVKHHLTQLYRRHGVTSRLEFVTRLPRVAAP